MIKILLSVPLIFVYANIVGPLLINTVYAKTLVPIECVANNASGICGTIPFYFAGAIVSPVMPGSSSLINGERLAIFSVGNAAIPACSFSAANNFDIIGNLAGIGIRHTSSTAGVDMVWSITANLSMAFNAANQINIPQGHNIYVANFVFNPQAYSPCYGPNVLHSPNTGGSTNDYFSTNSNSTVKPRIDYTLYSFTIAKREGMILPGRYEMSKSTKPVLTLGIYNNTSTVSSALSRVEFPLDLDIIVPIVCRASQTSFSSPASWINLKNNVYPNQPIGEPFLTDLIYSCTAGNVPNISMKLAGKFIPSVGSLKDNKLYLMNNQNRVSTVYVVGHANPSGGKINSCDATTSDTVKFNQETGVFDANTASSGVAIISQPYSWTLCSETKAVVPGAYKGAINYNLVLK